MALDLRRYPLTCARQSLKLSGPTRHSQGLIPDHRAKRIDESNREQQSTTENNREQRITTESKSKHKSEE